MTRALMLLALVLAASCAHAGLVETHFPGKTEEALAKEFEAGLNKMMEPRLKDPAPLRLALPRGKETIYCQLDSIDAATSTWVALAKSGFDGESRQVIWTATGVKHKVKPADLPPSGVAAWFDVPRCRPEVVVQVAIWLFGRKQPDLANAKLAHLSKTASNLRGEIEDYLCAKQAWTKPQGGLVLVDTCDIESGVEGFLLLPPELQTTRLNELEKQAKTVLKELDAARGDDRGAFGTRKKAPTLALHVLRDRYSRFEKAFKGTTTGSSTRILEKVKESLASVESDLKVISENRLRAEKLIIDEKFKEAAEIFDALFRGDPHNFELMQLCAINYWRAAGIKDGGNKCEYPDLMKRALSFYEGLLREFPRALSAMNYSGTCHQALGNKDKAKAFYNEVLKQADKEREKANREFAQKQLASIK
ncbi:MAG: hypothetical protein HPKKFMNG_00540 [Planctomycetes bacterium]|nr:hypothetical protein [Planctomycetota bacterium]HRJ77416.1 hypothetical protein [Planctomycetota bacterium]